MSEVVARQRRPVPALVGTAFGGLWAVLGAMALPKDWTTPAAVIGLLVTVFLLVQRSRGRGTGPSLFRRRAYGVSVVLEVVALYAAMLLLKQRGLEAYLVQALGLVVGLHFIGLWVASGQNRYLWLCACMCVVSLLGVALPGAVPGHFNSRNFVTAWGCALALWFTARPGAGGSPGGPNPVEPR